MISEHAIIEEGAQIGENVSIAAFALVSSEAIIGDGTSIAQGACIYGKTTIGKNNRIFSHAVIGSAPQDLKYNGEPVELIIGDNNTIREFTLFNPGTWVVVLKQSLVHITFSWVMSMWVMIQSLAQTVFLQMPQQLQDMLK